MLHERVGAYIEATGPESIDRNLDLLAHHYWHSDNLPKKREYLGRAGDAAQAAYANAAAIDYFERLAPLVARARPRRASSLKLGKVLELVGNWQRAEEVDSEALALAGALERRRKRARPARPRLAEVTRKQGRYDEALERLDRAAQRFESIGDESGVGERAPPRRHRRGPARGLREGGRELRGEPRDPRRASTTRRAWASLLSNLGIIAEYRADYERLARACTSARSAAHGDRRSPRHRQLSRIISG